MIIAFDIDGTWDRDPKGWIEVYNMLSRCLGHHCIFGKGITSTPH